MLIYVSFVQTQGTMRYNLWWNMPFNQHAPISPFTQIKCKRNAMTRFRTYWIISPTPKQNRKEIPLNPFVQTHYLYQVWIPKLCVHATCTNGTMQFILIYKRTMQFIFARGAAVVLSLLMHGNFSKCWYNRLCTYTCRYIDITKHSPLGRYMCMNIIISKYK